MNLHRLLMAGARPRAAGSRAAAVLTAALAAAVAATSFGARAEITVGVSVSATGPGASLGVPIQNTVSLLPKAIAGEPVRYVVLDDASDPTAGAKNLRRFTGEDKADVVLGSSSVPVATAQAVVAMETGTPFLALCPIAIDPSRQRFVFAIPQPVPLMVEADVQHMKAAGAKSVAFIGFSDPWGDLTYKALAAGTATAGIRISASERYGRADTSVTAQVLKIMAGAPEAVFVGGSGTPGALPQIALLERGYKGTIYHTHGVVNRDFLRVGGKDVEGAIAPTGPLVVAEQLPADHPSRQPATEFLRVYEAAYGPGSRNAFAGYAWDAGLVIAAAVPAALKRAAPGTEAFRAALRDAIEAVRDVAGTHGVYSMSPADHFGVDQRARVLVRVEKGEWRLIR